MNKELIELQKGIKATCVVIKDEDIQTLDIGIVFDAKINNNLFLGKTGNPFFREKLESILKISDIAYFVIRGIDEVSESMQNRYVGLVKDREFNGYKLPDNVIIVLTVKNTESLKKISKELYHFCVIAI